MLLALTRYVGTIRNKAIVVSLMMVENEMRSSRDCSWKRMVPACTQV